MDSASHSNLAQTRTVIMIAHRFCTIEQADLIVLMQQGQVVATGTHAQLMNSSAAYQQMLQAYWPDVMSRLLRLLGLFKPYLGWMMLGVYCRLLPC